MPARVLHLHRAIVASQSPYFSARLTTWYQPAAGPSHGGDGGSGREGKFVLVEHVEEEELEAAVGILQCTYSGKLNPELMGSAAQLLCGFRLASRWAVQACMDACAVALDEMGPQAWDADTLAMLYALPGEVLGSMKVSASIKATAKQRLLELFGNVPRVLEQDARFSREEPAVAAAGAAPPGTLHRQFLRLPYAAVLAWLHEDSLSVHSENCVLRLLSDWVLCSDAQAAAGGRRCTGAELLELAKGLRLVQLTGCGMDVLLPAVGWFYQALHCAPGGLAECRLLREGLEVAKVLRPLNSDSSLKSQRAWPLVPGQWQAGRRTGAAPELQVLTWTLNAVQVRALWAERCHKNSAHSVYHSGFRFRLRVMHIVSDASQSLYAGLMTGMELGRYPATDVRRNITVMATGRLRVVKGEDVSAGKWKTVTGLLVCGDPYGLHLIQRSRSGGDANASTMSQLLQPYLQADGGLRLEAAITAVH